MNFVCFNGKFLPDHEPLFTAQNRGFRYGDGVFETMKVYRGRIVLETFHWDRLFLSLKMLQVKNSLAAKDLSEMVLELCRKNNCLDSARVRLAVFRNQDNHAEWVMETMELPTTAFQWSEAGWSIDIYPYARKNPDAFSNLKTANFLPYVLAELFAKERLLDDAVVLNAFNFLADTSRANIFLVKNKEIHTPALHQGCINGVMRRFLLDELKRHNYKVHQGEVSEQQLSDADEVFLTNSIMDIQWVKTFREKTYTHDTSYSIYQNLTRLLYAPS